jgi:DNA-binding transcriptional LysR family regulator
MERLSDVEVFVRVVEASSFSRAAEQLGISRSYASRMVSGLEARLAVRLLHRTTRKVATTATGQWFYETSAPLIDGIASAEARAKEESRIPRGTLRLSVPAAFGLRHLVAPLLAFQAANPEVRLTVQFDERKVDLLGEGLDLAIRGGEVTSGQLVARALWPFRILTAASPAYLAKRGVPLHPQDLLRHACLSYSGNNPPGTWTYMRAEERVSVDIDGPVSFNTAPALVSGAVAGVGLVWLPDWALEDELRAGRLVRVLQGWEGALIKFWLVRPDRRHVPERVRAFQEHLLAAFPSPSWLQV